MNNFEANTVITAWVIAACAIITLIVLLVKRSAVVRFDNPNTLSDLLTAERNLAIEPFICEVRQLMNNLDMLKFENVDKEIMIDAVHRELLITNCINSVLYDLGQQMVPSTNPNKFRDISIDLMWQMTQVGKTGNKDEFQKGIELYTQHYRIYLDAAMYGIIASNLNQIVLKKYMIDPTKEIQELMLSALHDEISLLINKTFEQT